MTPRILSARLHPYDLPLRRPWAAASGVLARRRGVLLRLSAGGGLTGWGDCAPLPSRGPARAARVLAALDAAARGLAGRAAAALWAGPALAAEPEAAWAVETALADLMARAAGLPLARWLSDDAAGSVAVNAALGALDDATPDRAAEAAAQGFDIAKIKVGLAPVEDDLARLRAVAARAGPGLRLRLDANRAWAGAEAARLLDGLDGLPVDGVEEPLAAPDPAALARLQARVPFALAADESLPALGLGPLLAAGAVRRIVVKPARLGGLRATRALAAQARAAGVETVLTSVVDSAVGVTAAAHLAASLPAPEIAHGLGTLGWLARDVAPGPAMAGGRLALPAGPGLGLHPGLAAGEPRDG